MRSLTRHLQWSCLACLLSCLLLPLAGCASFASHMMYWIKGNKIEARCTALEEKSVAVVCVTGEKVEGIGLNNEGDNVTRLVATLLATNVKKVKVIPPEKVADWRDTNNWDEVDYRTIGRGVKADMVVAIDLSSFTLHDNSTLLRGRSNLKTTVYDINDNGKIIFRDGPKEFVFPEGSGRHSVENEANFHRIYLMMLAQDVAKNFYPYDKAEDFAKDASYLGH
jgi:hypothetical protein